MSRKKGRSCRGKRRYRDDREACRALHRLANSSRQKVPGRSYYCARCKGWHLTSQPLRS